MANEYDAASRLVQALRNNMYANQAAAVSATQSANNASNKARASAAGSIAARASKGNDVLGGLSPSKPSDSVVPPDASLSAASPAEAADKDALARSSLAAEVDKLTKA